ncbi:MAG: DUF134 domain-containing protein [Phycisphaerae bacterium]|nr:DUF134 domain-containing protein [Phycisphaerae bacterium]
MPRPAKRRMIAGQPVATVYKPAGVPAHALQWTYLLLDEFEAIRLIDGENLDQEAAAVQMGVSRPTVTRILASARRKIAYVLTHGQALGIKGGPVICGRGGGQGRGGRSGGGQGRGGGGRCGLGRGQGRGREFGKQQEE